MANVPRASPNESAHGARRKCVTGFLRKRPTSLCQFLSVPQPLTPEELKARPTDAGQAGEDEEDPWAALDPNEHEGPSAPPAPTAKAEASPKAASTGVPLPENEPSGTVYPKNSKGQVEKYRYMLDEDIGGYRREGGGARRG